MCVCINIYTCIYIYTLVLDASFPSASVPEQSLLSLFPSFIFLSHALLQHDVFHSCPRSAGAARLIP